VCSCSTDLKPAGTPPLTSASAALRQKSPTKPLRRIHVQEMDTAAQKPQKDLGIESLRGIAIMMVVICHVVLDHKNPLYPNSPGLLEWLQHLCLSTEYVRMPLFTVISGFVYALRPAAARGAVEFVRGQARRLIIPFVFVTTLNRTRRSLRASLIASPIRWPSSGSSPPFFSAL
jgi:fucose 4-O-acetylase-like acetyltransferase